MIYCQEVQVLKLVASVAGVEGTGKEETMKEMEMKCDGKLVY
jgi:hypothetical protein